MRCEALEGGNAGGVLVNTATAFPTEARAYRVFQHSPFILLPETPHLNS
jgi:hypothetical protein